MYFRIRAHNIIEFRVRSIGLNPKKKQVFIFGDNLSIIINSASSITITLLFIV